MEVIYEYIIRLLLALALGGLVGLEREKSRKPAGLRTNMLVCVGAALITIFGIIHFNDYTRVINGIITGIGFIGAGTIIAQGTKSVHGLTTAATLWVMAIIGICIGAGEYILSIIATILIMIVLFFGRFEKFVG